MGYREHAQNTATGEAVHTASLLQDLTKEYACQLVVSEIAGATAGVPLADFPSHEMQIRGFTAPLTIRAVGNAAALPPYERPSASSETDRIPPPGAPVYAQST